MTRIDRTLGVTLLALAVMAGALALGHRFRRPVPASASWTRAQQRAELRVAGWPAPARELASVMIERLGPPDRTEPERLVWTRQAPFKRIAVHRSSAAPLEHALEYDVPIWAEGWVLALGLGTRISEDGSEISVRGTSEPRNLIALNLVSEVIAGSRTPSEARAFHAKSAALAAAGKSSPYLERLLFVPHRPRPRPWGGLAPAPSIPY